MTFSCRQRGTGTRKIPLRNRRRGAEIGEMLCGTAAGGKPLYSREWLIAVSAVVCIGKPGNRKRAVRQVYKLTDVRRAAGTNDGRIRWGEGKLIKSLSVQKIHAARDLHLHTTAQPQTPSPVDNFLSAVDRWLMRLPARLTMSTHTHTHTHTQVGEYTYV